MTVEKIARGSVSQVLSGVSPPVDGHSSTTGVTAGLQQPTRTTGPVPALSRQTATRRPYSVLLPVGFTLPLLLPVARCALTAPFQPCRRHYPKVLAPAVSSLWHCPWGCPRRALPGTVVPWSPDFPPLSCDSGDRPILWPGRNVGAFAKEVKRLPLLAKPPHPVQTAQVTPRSFECAHCWSCR